jgi:hypothetical protein
MESSRWMDGIRVRKTGSKIAIVIFRFPSGHPAIGRLLVSTLWWSFQCLDIGQINQAARCIFKYQQVFATQNSQWLPHSLKFATNRTTYSPSLSTRS